jgi:hypothetical protein
MASLISFTCLDMVFTPLESPVFQHWVKYLLLTRSLKPRVSSVSPLGDASASGCLTALRQKLLSNGVYLSERESFQKRPYFVAKGDFLKGEKNETL